MKSEKLNKIAMDRVSKDFFDLLEQLNDDEWNLKVNKNWTIKDCIAHLIGWEKEGVNVLEKSWKSGKNPWFMKNDDDYKEFNKIAISKYKDWKPKKLIQEWKHEQKLFDREVKKIGEDKLKKNPEFAWVFDETIDNHYLEHLKQIKKALRRV